MTHRPLEGLVVVALEQAVAIPLASRQLADAGARVIKIEPVGRGDIARHYDDAMGPGYSSWFVWLNRGKESVALDLKDTDDQRVLHDLLARADVFVQNLSPGMLTAKGIDLDAIHAANPNLISCSLTGYGPEGPNRDRKAYDLLIQSEAGLVTLTGTADDPAKAGLSVADIAGGMYTYSNVLLALIQRGRTGVGTHIELSLFDALLEWLGHQVIFTRELDRLPRRNGARHATIAPYGPFPCSDGNDVVLAVQSAHEWNAMCEILHLDALHDDPRFARNDDRVVNGAELDARIAAATAQMSSDELIAQLEAHGLAWARVNDMFEVLEHPQLAARHRWVDVETPNGSFSALRAPMDFADWEPAVGSVPALGEHTERVKAWLAEQ
jgi:crotonobetainyl-CoA:carnitine CoA-transferase CaiB-like acyl-CoA transferase